MSKVIVVGAGMSGLTASAYLTKYGYDVTLIEQGDKVGGLVSSFPYKGFILDGGVRSTESNGVLFPMLKQLGISDKITFDRSVVSLGFEDQMVEIGKKEDIENYRNLLKETFPTETEAIDFIFKDIYLFMDYMDIIYGIDNPLFLDMKEDRDYLVKTILPWMFKFLMTVGKIGKYKTPVNTYLSKYTSNKSLIDLIAQHFFQETPAFFALSYFTIYLDYHYPRGGTGVIMETLESLIKDQGGRILLDTLVTSIDVDDHYVYDQNNNSYPFGYLVWAADQKALYKSINIDKITNSKLRKDLKKKLEFLEDKDGGDSVLTAYYLVDQDPSEFKKIASGHIFYTPSTKDLSDLKMLIDSAIHQPKTVVFEALKQYFETTTYEISIPAVRDASMAPKGQTALIVSTLMDYKLTKYILDLGWYDEFKQFTIDKMLSVLSSTLFKGLKNHVFDSFTSTPITINQRVKSTDGAITGWAFTNKVNPSVDQIPKVSKSIRTPMAHILQTGQWAYSPAGLPTAMMTGKLAADRIRKKLKIK
jgi:phytoene dehydrogenase-like protein